MISLILKYSLLDLFLMGYQLQDVRIDNVILLILMEIFQDVYKVKMELYVLYLLMNNLQQQVLGMVLCIYIKIKMILSQYKRYKDFDMAFIPPLIIKDIYLLVLKMVQLENLINSLIKQSQNKFIKMLLERLHLQNNLYLQYLMMEQSKNFHLI